MRRWLRVTMPSAWFTVAIIGYLSVIAIEAGFHYAHFGEVVFPFQNEFAEGLLGLIATAYGVFRVLLFHPANWTAHRNWLMQTPWRLGDPLPYGPVALVPQDLCFVGLLWGLAHFHLDATPLIIPCKFLLAYVTASLFSLGLTKRFAHVYLVLMGLGGLIPVDDIGYFLAGIAGLYVVVLHGFRSGFRDIYHWDFEHWERLVVMQTNAAKAQELRAEQQLGWPHDQLLPRRSRFPVSIGAAVAVAVLGGWWCLMLSTLVGPRQMAIVPGFASLFAVVIGIARICIYLQGCSPPLGFWGRLWTLRWIIPQFDTVFVPSLFVLVAVGVINFLCVQQLLLPQVAGPLMVSTALLVLLAAPPTLDQWRFTGGQRYGPPGVFQAGQFEQTK